MDELARLEAKARAMTCCDKSSAYSLDVPKLVARLRATEAFCDAFSVWFAKYGTWNKVPMAEAQMDFDALSAAWATTKQQLDALREGKV